MLIAYIYRVKLTCLHNLNRNSYVTHAHTTNIKLAPLFPFSFITTGRSLKKWRHIFGDFWLTFQRHSRSKQVLCSVNYELSFRLAENSRDWQARRGVCTVHFTTRSVKESRRARQWWDVERGTSNSNTYQHTLYSNISRVFTISVKEQHNFETIIVT